MNLEETDDLRVYSESDAARLLGVHQNTLRRMVDRGEGPAKIKLSTRRVGYRATELRKFLETRTSIG